VRAGPRARSILPHTIWFRIVLAVLACRLRGRFHMRNAFAAMLILTIAVTGFTQAPAPQAGRGGRGGGPEPRIVTFEARPSSVRPGESVVLVWSTENPSGITIDPDIGVVAARGTKQIKPSATTTYTLSLRGGPSKTVTVTVAGTTAAASSPASANAVKK